MTIATIFCINIGDTQFSNYVFIDRNSSNKTTMVAGLNRKRSPIQFIVSCICFLPLILYPNIGSNLFGETKEKPNNKMKRRMYGSLFREGTNGQASIA